MKFFFFIEYHNKDISEKSAKFLLTEFRIYCFVFLDDIGSITKNVVLSNSRMVGTVERKIKKSVLS